MPAPLAPIVLGVIGSAIGIGNFLKSEITYHDLRGFQIKQHAPMRMQDVKNDKRRVVVASHNGFFVNKKIVYQISFHYAHDILTVNVRPVTEESNPGRFDDGSIKIIDLIPKYTSKEVLLSDGSYQIIRYPALEFFLEVHVDWVGFGEEYHNIRIFIDPSKPKPDHISILFDSVTFPSSY